MTDNEIKKGMLPLASHAFFIFFRIELVLTRN